MEIGIVSSATFKYIVMNLRRLYVNDLIPAYSNMLISLDNGVVGNGNMLKSVKDVCDIFNNIVDYIAVENHAYILEFWNAKNSKEFRNNLEILDHKIMGFNVKGSFFGMIRDVANTSKHLNIGRDGAQINSTENIRESLSYIRFEDERGYYYSYKSTVISTHVDSSKIPIEIYLYLCFLTFTSILVDLNIIPNKPDILERRSFYKSRDDADRDGNPTIEVTVGEPVNLVLSSFIYQDDIISELRGLKPGDCFNHTLNLNIISKKGLFF